MASAARVIARGTRPAGAPDSYERLRIAMIEGARPLVDLVVASSLHFADRDVLTEIAETGLRFVSSVPRGELPDALPADLRTMLARMAHAEPDNWDVPAEVRRTVIHEAFVFTGQFLSERAFAAGIDKVALRHWIDVMQRFEALLQSFMASTALDVQHAKSERARIHEACLLAEWVRDPVVTHACQPSSFVHDGPGKPTTTPAEKPPAPLWLTDPETVVCAVLVRDLSTDVSYESVIPPVTAELPRPSIAALHQPESILLVPADAIATVEPRLVKLFASGVVVVGLPMPLSRAEQSLAWCRRAASLHESGVVTAPADGGAVRCADLVPELLIAADPALLRATSDSLLRPFSGLTEYRRTILLETLEAWCRRPHIGIPAIARELDKHPQTIRYRLGQLRLLIGDALDDDRQLLLMRLVFTLQPAS